MSYRGTSGLEFQFLAFMHEVSDISDDYFFLGGGFLALNFLPQEHFDHLYNMYCIYICWFGSEAWKTGKGPPCGILETECKISG